MSNEARDIIEQLEAHCGETVGSKRLRFQIVNTLQREIDKHARLSLNIAAVLSGAEIYNRKTHKTINLPKSQQR